MQPDAADTGQADIFPAGDAVAVGWKPEGAESSAAYKDALWADWEAWDHDSHLTVQR